MAPSRLLRVSKDKTTLDIRKYISIIDAKSFVIVSHCAVEIPLGFLRDTTTAVGECVFRVDADRLIVVGDRPIKFASGISCCATTAVSKSIVGVDADRLIVIGNHHLIKFALSVSSDTTEAEGKGVAVVEFDGLVEIFDRSIKRALVQQGFAAAAISECVFRVDADRLIVVGDRPGKIAFSIFGLGRGLYK